MICISTPLDSFNFYSELTDVKDENGNHIFNVIKVGMVCEKCKRTEHPEKCMHKIAERPAWKDKDKFSTVKQIYGDRITYLQRESMYVSLSLTHRGHVAGADNAVFQSKWVAELKKQPLFDEVPSPPIQKVIISCDPNGGGTSHMAIVSAFYYKRVMVVSMGGGGGAIA